MKRIIALVLMKFVTALQLNRSLDASMRYSSPDDENNTKSIPLLLSGCAALSPSPTPGKGFPDPNFSDEPVGPYCVRAL